MSSHFQWNYTTYLNIVFLAVFGFLYWAYRNRDRLGGGDGHALDPVCGMQVKTVDAAASTRHEESTYYFCSDSCTDKFEADPVRFAEHTARPKADRSSDREMSPASEPFEARR
ncbi:MAG: YHS domain-containing protein [Acidimicrobiales bacterium]|nr:YHS domain-containing protein [Acidimicrobiales bacterium]